MRIVLSMLFIAFGMSTMCQEAIQVNSTVSNVTLYTAGALVKRKIEIPRGKGVKEIEVRGISKGFHEQSVQIEGSEGIDILSLEFRTTKLRKVPSNINKNEVTHQIELFRDSLSLHEFQVDVFTKEKSLILSNDSFRTENGGVSIEELKEAAKFYSQRLSELNNSIWKNELEQKRLNREILELQNKLDEKPKLEGKEERVAVIKLNVHPLAERYAWLSYYIPNAGWFPCYDLKVDDKNDGVLMSRKALMYQHTEEDWGNVKVNLSSYNPTLGNVKPILRPNYWGENVGLFRNEYVNYGRNTGRILNENGEPLIGATVVIVGTSQGVTTDFDGFFYFPEAVGKPISISYVGYNSIELNLHRSRQTIQMSSSYELLEEIVVTSAGRRGKSIRKNKKQTRSTQLDKIETELASVLYDLKGEYDILGNGQEKEVLVEELNILGKLIYQSVPNESQFAFLTYRLEEWAKYQLMPGRVNLFYKKRYMGESVIPTSYQKNNLDFSIGHDESIVIEKEKIVDFHTDSFFSTKDKKTESWKISIVNNKMKTITLELLDQYPLSREDDIKIKLLESSEAEVDKEKGFLKWEVTLAPNEKQTRLFTYEVKY